jgi:hypothetical protein
MNWMKYEYIRGFKEADFREVTGVTPSTFISMTEELKEAYRKVHKKRGRHRKLSIEDMLLMTLEYYKEYRTLKCIGASYGLCKINVSKTIQWVENVLIKSGLFNLPGKKKLAQSNIEYEIIVVDSTETPIQRPKNEQKKHYSGKKNATQ